MYVWIERTEIKAEQLIQSKMYSYWIKNKIITATFEKNEI